MASDISRKTFNPDKHYNGVLMQQGRVQLDADWNEQLDIQQYRTHTETKDVIGESGVPKNVNNGNSFKITVPTTADDLVIASGRMYVGGLLCELSLPEQASYLKQPYYPNPDTTPYFNPASASPPYSPVSPPLSSPLESGKLKDGTFIVYIDAWQREVNYLDDPLIQEVALDGPDTTTRLQTVWQVKLLKVENSASNTDLCKRDFKEWQNVTASPTGKLNVQATDVQDSKNPCELPPSAGFRRLENQLYRVEVQQGGNRGQAKFKWSRDNASVETSIEKVEGNILTVAEVGKDEILRFANGQWVEIVDEESTLKSKPRPLIEIDFVDTSNRKIILKTAVNLNTSYKNLKLRRWDQNSSSVDLSAAGSWIDLEDGIQVTFSEGTYRAGDYWLIPARTATGDVEWVSGAQPPLGTHHHYCKLAVVQMQRGSLTVQDCRPLFPPLTELTANDDLRLHHKYVHGYGVICGLKVKCGINRQSVTIEKGNALDCEGYMIQVKQEIRYENIVGKARESGFLDRNNNGTVCLSIARGSDRSGIIEMEQFESQSFWDRVLEGTLLKDFYEDCILNLIDFFKAQFPFPLTDEAPVPNTQRRLTAFINLFTQLINTKSGPYGFISGNTQSEKLDEDQFLRNFHNDLKAELASKTFCAMYDNDTPFPDYSIDGGLQTIFGPAVKMHTRLRLHPSRTFAYTCGNNNRVYVYNLKEQELIQSYLFPAAAGIVVQDITVSETELFAVGVLGSDSIFAKAEILANGQLRWDDNTSTSAGIKYVTLGMAENRLFAIAKARGLYEISGIGGGTAFLTRLIGNPPGDNFYNATGLLHITQFQGRWLAFVAVCRQAIGEEADVFIAYYIYDLDTRQRIAAVLGLSGSDAANDITSLEGKIYITSNDSAGQRILSEYDILTGQPSKIPAVIPAENSIVRLAIYRTALDNRGDYVLLTLSDQLKVIRVPLNNPDQLVVDESFRIPVQLFPIDIAINNQNTNGYVLNMLANTLTAMDMRQVFSMVSPPDYTFEPPISDLDTYRDQAIEAYQDVLSHLIQYMKDCFCDQFLVDCPDCDDDDKVYLGCVDIKNGRVHHICNFSKRKYVKSFKMVEYWMSVIPVMPLVREAFAQFCCMVIEPYNKKEATSDNNPFFRRG